jgi:hypothetical protein
MDVVNTGREIGKIVPKDFVVVAAEPFYFGMVDHRGFVGGLSDKIMIGNSDLSEEEAWAKIAPDALVFASGRPTEPERGPELLAYVQRNNFGLAGCWQTLAYGRVELWMRNPPSTISPGDHCPVVSG